MLNDKKDSENPEEELQEDTEDTAENPEDTEQKSKLSPEEKISQLHAELSQERKEKRAVKQQLAESLTLIDELQNNVARLESEAMAKATQDLLNKYGITAADDVQLINSLEHVEHREALAKRLATRTSDTPFGGSAPAAKPAPKKVQVEEVSGISKIRKSIQRGRAW